MCNFRLADFFAERPVKKTVLVSYGCVRFVCVVLPLSHAFAATPWPCPVIPDLYGVCGGLTVSARCAGGQLQRCFELEKIRTRVYFGVRKRSWVFWKPQIDVS